MTAALKGEDGEHAGQAHRNVGELEQPHRDDRGGPRHSDHNQANAAWGSVRHFSPNVPKPARMFAPRNAITNAKILSCL